MSASARSVFTELPSGTILGVGGSAITGGADGLMEKDRFMQCFVGMGGFMERDVIP